MWELFVRSCEDFKYNHKINAYYQYLASFDDLEKSTVHCTLGKMNVSFPISEKEMASIGKLEKPMMLNITLNSQKVLIGSILNEYLEKDSEEKILPSMNVCNLLFTDSMSCRQIRKNYWRNQHLNINLVLLNTSRAYVDTKKLLNKSKGLMSEISNSDIKDVQMIQEYVIKCLQNNISEIDCYEEKMAAFIDENVMKISLDEHKVLKSENKMSVKRKF